MCGIAGIINFNGHEDKQALLRRMLGLIRHRGSDAFGIYASGPVGLASARLSIIDLCSGDQPITNEDHSIWVVFNGEIFNYPELRKELKSLGHRFSTHSDTEALVHLYEEHGEEMLERLNGQFAFALWDSKKDTLLLARDRVGIRPLFYHLAGGRLVFGSEIKVLFADKNIPRGIDPHALADIFTCWSPLGTSTSFEDIFQIPPGHLSIFSPKGFKTRSYWQLMPNGRDTDPAVHERSLENWADELNGLLQDAVRIRLKADVPVGTYLSGGLDSTFTTALVKRNFNNSLCSFSVRFADDRFDESGFQNMAVKALNTVHHHVLCFEKDIGETFPQVIWHTETPVLRTSPAPLFHLSRLVHDKKFKVVLTGEGADEIFAGYNIFKEDQVRRFWSRDPESRLRPMLFKKLYPYIFSQQNDKAGLFLNRFFKKGLSETNSPVYSHLLRWLNTSQIKFFFSADIQQQNGDLSQFVDRYVSMLPAGFMNWHPLTRAQYAEMRIFLPNYLLSSQGDRMTMAHSVEGRYPFLDHRLVELAFKMPPRFRLNGLDEKYILKKAAKDIVPAEIVKRPKQPYRAPISRCFWDKTPLDYVKELLSESAIRQSGYFEPEKIAQLLAKCDRQNGNLTSERENMALVGILSTQLVDQMFIRDFPAYAVQEPQDVKVFTE